MKISVGADPELFVFDGGTPVSAHGMIKGTKDKPFKVKNGAVQVDGMALEFNIDPANDEESFVNNLNSVMATLNSMIAKNLSMIVCPVANFGEEYIKNQPEEAYRLGCTPDFDAWADCSANNPPNANLPFRTAAGHVHIGWTKVDNEYDYEHIQECGKVVKQLDYFLGLPSLFFDKDTKRREMYGKPGCFRPKTYGAEYRVLSNQWLLNDDLKRWVFRSVQSAMNRYEKKDFVFDKVNEKILKNLTSRKPDLVRVHQVLEKLDIELPPQLGKVA